MSRWNRWPYRGSDKDPLREPRYGKLPKPILSPRIEARRKMARIMFAKPGRISRGRVAMMKLLFRADAGR